MSLEQKTFVVTGANTGIGKITARELAKHGAHVILACRSKEKTDAVLEEIRAAVPGANIEFVPLDLADLASVRACATALLERDIPIHGLINNAGLAGTRGQTKDGFEIQFGTNHLGHYLLTRLLLDKIIASGPARIVNVSSASHYQAKGIDWTVLQQPTKTITALNEYSVSKLANVLFTKELARKLAGTQVTAYAVHPGVVATDVWRKVPGPVRWLMKKFMITPEKGAQATLRCATAPELAAETGKYYDVGGKEKRPSRVADDTALAETLWTKSA
ncbi:MAG TPA: SDR family oxidoreductase, partial [Kofleriaceae bacterium]|nr:SDR family oxidoreductase [Kofleriaceae bacterium]